MATKTASAPVGLPDFAALNGLLSDVNVSEAPPQSGRGRKSSNIPVDMANAFSASYDANGAYRAVGYISDGNGSSKAYENEKSKLRNKANNWIQANVQGGKDGASASLLPVTDETRKWYKTNHNVEFPENPPGFILFLVKIAPVEESVSTR